MAAIDREELVADRLQVAPKAGVADQRLVALGELALQRGDDRGAVGGILLRLLMVAADDVAPSRQHHGLGLVVDLFTALLHRQRDERRRIVEHQLAQQLVGSSRTPRIYRSRRASSSATVSCGLLASSFGKFTPWNEQQQLLFAVTDFKLGVFDVNLGLGFGLTPGSDQLTGKAIIEYAFPVPGSGSRLELPGPLRMAR